MKKKQKVILSETDLDILRALYKFDFMMTKDLAAIVGISVETLNGRLKNLANAGLINRKTVEKFAVNWITRDGIKEAGLEPRSIITPKLNNRYLHSLGVSTVCTWFSCWRTNSSGNLYQLVPLGSIITERDFIAADPTLITKKNKKTGIHAPDAFFCQKDGTFAAIEFERTPKSRMYIVEKNVTDNAKRFVHQYWIYDDLYVGRTLKKIQSKFGASRMSVYDMRDLKKQMDAYLSILPGLAEVRHGTERRSCLGVMAEPIPLNKLPLLNEYSKKVELEHRSPMADSHPDNSRTIATDNSPTYPTYMQRNPAMIMNKALPQSPPKAEPPAAPPIQKSAKSLFERR